MRLLGATASPTLVSRGWSKQHLLERQRKRLQRRAEQASRKSNPCRKHYNTKRWQELRDQVIAAAGGRCERTGIALVGPPRSWNSPVVDHIMPHEGNEQLFWDPKNLQCVSRQYHDAVKRARERAVDRSARRPAWLEPSACPLTIVVGPEDQALAFIEKTRGPDDRVIALGPCLEAVSGLAPGPGLHDERSMNAGVFLRNYWLGELNRAPAGIRAWFACGDTNEEAVQWFASKLRAEDVIRVG